MKIGVLGLGFMGRVHLGAYRGIPEAEVVAVASSDDRKLSGDLGLAQGNLGPQRDLINFNGVSRYRTAQELFADRQVEAVDLCLPTYLHAPLAKAALEAGKHVLVEKPMALSSQECQMMIDVAQKCKKVLMVAHVVRYWPAYVMALNLVRSGKFGLLKSALFRRECAAPTWSNWMMDRSKSGGGVFDLLIHDIDYCIYLLGKPKAVKAIGTDDFERSMDHAKAQLIYDSGASIEVSGGWHPSNTFPFSMGFSIVCENGKFEFQFPEKPYKLKVYPRDGAMEELSVPDSDAFQAELKAFINACTRGRYADECPPEDSASAISVALAMRKSCELRGDSVVL
jgi:predicted dehydrogenase